VNRVASDQANTGMMAAMVQMAGSLNLTAIAEIIETEEAVTALQEMGCDYGQGYYFSEPLEAEPALQRLREQQPVEPPQRTSATVRVEPSRDTSATVKVQQGTSATIKLRPLDEDDSPTMVMKDEAQ